METKYWLFKTEPTTYSIDDFKKDKKTLWDGIRNYQARNFMMREMSLNDEILIYHSSTKIPGVVGTASVSKLAVPDPEQFNINSPYFDIKSSKKKPIWHCVEISFKKKLSRLISLEEIKKNYTLTDILLVQRGTRLSIQPLLQKDYKEILNML